MCKPGDKQRVFSPPISTQMSRCMCLCVSYIAPFTKTSAPIFIWLRSRKENGQWAEIPSLWILSLRPLPVLLDICIRHSFESQNRNIKVFSVPLNPTLEEKCVPRRHWGPNHKGKKNDQNKQKEGKLSEAVICFILFWSSNFAFMWMDCIGDCECTFLYMESALWMLANYTYCC